MPSGIIHEKYRSAFATPVTTITVVLSVGVAVALKNILPVVTGTSLIVSYSLTKYIDPDLDQVGRTKSETRMLDSFGPIVGRIFQIWWAIYAGIMNVLATFFGISHPLYGAHRTVLTHSIWLGTPIRLIWFDLPIVTVWYTFYDYPVAWTPYILSLLLGQLCAFLIADYIHIWLDNHYKEGINEPTRSATRTRRTSRTRRKR